MTGCNLRFPGSLGARGLPPRVERPEAETTRHIQELKAPCLLPVDPELHQEHVYVWVYVWVCMLCVHPWVSLSVCIRICKGLFVCVQVYV